MLRVQLARQLDGAKYACVERNTAAPEFILEEAVVKTCVVRNEQPAFQLLQDGPVNVLECRRQRHHRVGDAGQRLDMRAGLRQRGGGRQRAFVGVFGAGIEPGLAETLLVQARNAADQQESMGLPAVLLVPDRVRTLLVRLLRRSAPRLRVLGHSARLVWHKDNSLGDADAVIVPGGFSYGDYLRCGAIARFSPRDAERWPEYCERMAALAAFLADRYLEPPPDPLVPPTATWVVRMQTSCGPITITLDPETGGAATASFAALARAGYYDGLAFHRVVPGFVVQGGDPNGNGSGGPGYTVDAPPPSDYRYRNGDVAMAKAGNEPAGAAGSQFFIVYADSMIPSDEAGGYTVIGRITSPLDQLMTDVIDRGVRDGTNDGAPMVETVITSFTLK